MKVDEINIQEAEDDLVFNEKYKFEETNLMHLSGLNFDHLFCLLCY